MIRPRQVGRVIKRHALDLMRDRRTLFALLTVPILTVILMTFAREELIGSISDTARISHRVAVDGARHAPSFISDLGFTNLEVVDSDDVHASVRDGDAAVGMIFPRNFERRLERGDRVPLTVVQGPSSTVTRLAESSLNGAINAYIRIVVNERLEAEGLDPEFARPVQLRSENVATPEELSGSVLAEFLPFLVIAQVVALMTGIAIDITAGEKERRTIEALVATPLARREIVFGKWLVTVVIGSFGATVTIAAALISFRRASGDLLGDVALLPAGAIGALVASGVAIALLIGSIQLLIGIFSRSVQQAAAMASPLFFIVFLPLFLLQGQTGSSISSAMYAVPALGPTMLARFGLAGSASASALPIALISSTVYAVLVLMAADRLFRSERALLRI